MSHSDFMSRHANDIAAELELDAYDAESCPNGHHPDMVDQLVPVWVACGLCRQVEDLQKTGQPPGSHIALVTHEEAARRAELRARYMDD